MLRLARTGQRPVVVGDMAAALVGGGTRRRPAVLPTVFIYGVLFFFFAWFHVRRFPLRVPFPGAGLAIAAGGSVTMFALRLARRLGSDGAVRSRWWTASRLDHCCSSSLGGGARQRALGPMERLSDQSARGGIGSRGSRGNKAGLGRNRQGGRGERGGGGRNQ